MTDIELENKANRYVVESCKTPENVRLFGEILKRTYITAVKENCKSDTVWHDLRKNPQDLPNTGGKYFVCTGEEPFVASFDTETNAFGYWSTVLGENLEVSDEIFETLEEIDEGDVIAWCKLPIFEG